MRRGEVTLLALQLAKREGDLGIPPAQEELEKLPVVELLPIGDPESEGAVVILKSLMNHKSTRATQAERKPNRLTRPMSPGFLIHPGEE